MRRILTVSVVAAAAVCIGVTLGGNKEALKYWPSWRGPLSNGVAPHGDPPIEWSETKNVRWKVELPGPGHATPVVWGDRIYVLSAVRTETTVEPADAPEPAEGSSRPARSSEIRLASLQEQVPQPGHRRRGRRWRSDRAW